MTSPHVPISRDTAEHYKWGDGCDGWYLVRTDALSVIQERMPHGASEVRHRHTRARQFFVVLSGELGIEVEGTTHKLHAGSGLEVPPGSAHTVRAVAAGGTDFIVVSQPPAHGDRELVP